MGQITAGTLQIGNTASYTGTIGLASAVNVGAAAAGTAAGSFNLSLQSGGAINTFTGGFAITSNTNNLTLNSTQAAGTSITLGAVVLSSGTVTATGTNAVLVKNGLAPSSGGNLTVSSANSTVEIDGAVSTTGTVSYFPSFVHGSYAERRLNRSRQY